MSSQENPISPEEFKRFYIDYYQSKNVESMLSLNHTIGIPKEQINLLKGYIVSNFKNEIPIISCNVININEDDRESLSLFHEAGGVIYKKNLKPINNFIIEFEEFSDEGERNWSKEERQIGRYDGTYFFILSAPSK